jgi:hypothetical protein
VSAQVERAVDGRDRAGGRQGRLWGRALALAAAADPGPVTYVGSIVVPPGPYTLKLAAATRGPAGSRAPGQALITAGGLEMSDPMIGPPPAAGRTFASADLGAGRPRGSGGDVRADRAAEEGRGRDRGCGGETARRSCGIPATPRTPEGGRRVARGPALGPASRRLPVRAVVSMDGKARARRVPFCLDPSASHTADSRVVDQGMAPIGRFETRSVLEPDVVGHFLGQWRSSRPVRPRPGCGERTGAQGRRHPNPDALPAVGPEEARFCSSGAPWLRADRLRRDPLPDRAAPVLELFPAVSTWARATQQTGRTRRRSAQTAPVTRPAIPPSTASLTAFRCVARVAGAVVRAGAPPLARGRRPRRRVGLAYAMAAEEVLAALTDYVERQPKSGRSGVTPACLTLTTGHRGNAARGPEQAPRAVLRAAKRPNQETSLAGSGTEKPLTSRAARLGPPTAVS